MRVAIMPWAGTQWLGGWNYYLNMARVLSRCAPEIRLCPFCPPGVTPERRREMEDATGEPSGELPVRSRYTDALALAGWKDRELIRRLENRRVDLVFEQGRFVGRGWPIPVVSWIADLQHRTYPEFFSLPYRLARDVGFRSQLRFRRHVIVSSGASRAELLRYYPRPKAAIDVVPFAVKPIAAVTEAGIDETRRRYRLPETYLFLPNQMWRHKNHVTAFRALAELRRRGQPLQLALSGGPIDPRNPKYSAEVSELAASLQLDRQITWLGVIPHDDLLHLMAGAAAVLNPSFYEGWSTTVEEAKTLGARLVLSAIAVHLEQAPQNAHFFDPSDPTAMADAIATAIAEPRDRVASRLDATARNAADQELYAARLQRVFTAARS